MTYSDKYKCIFVHLIKTAGESINAALGMKKKHYHVSEVNFAKAGSHKPGGGIGCHYTNDDEYHLWQVQKRWSHYFKFSVVRNPWDRFVSEYNYNRRNKYWSKRGLKQPTFREIVLQTDFHNDYWKKSQCTWLRHNGKIAVDKVMKFENIANEMKQQFGVDLPHVNKSNHAQYAKNKHYSDYYDDHTKYVIAQAYADDIEEFGYKFEKVTQNSSK
jgi:hypothetical protein